MQRKCQRHTKHFGDDRPPRVAVRRVHHDGAGDTRFAGYDHTARRHPAGTVLLREDPFSLDTTRGRYAARLVLVDSLQSAWQCAKYEENGHLLMTADPEWPTSTRCSNCSGVCC